MKTEKKPTLLDLGFNPKAADALANYVANYSSDQRPDFVRACSISTLKSPLQARLMRSLMSKDHFEKKRQRRERRHQK